MQEIWKDVKDYEGFYQVSNLGNVRSLDRYVVQNNNGTSTKTLYKGKILNKHKRGDYFNVHLSKNNKAEWKLIHRLVAEAFIEKEDGKNIVNHIDNNPHNNCANNLEWTTYKGNMQHASKQGRMRCNYENLKKAQESKKIPVVGTKKRNRLLF